MRRWLRRTGAALAVVMVVLAAMAGYALCEARRDPVVRTAAIGLVGWPAAAPPLHVLLWSDIHLGNRATDAARLRRLVDRANALRPDAVLLAGDFIAGHGPAHGRAVAPVLGRELARLRAPLGAVAVLGNHDHWSDAAAVTRALRSAHIRVLVNAAAPLGPIALGGVDDNYTHRDRLGPTLAAMRRLAGPRLLLTHSPDLSPSVPSDVPLVLAGHSHCGQLVLPLLGPPKLPLRTGRRYLCGVVREPRRVTIVGAGTGTSVLPLRLGAPPDWWLLTLGPPRPRQAAPVTPAAPH